LRKALFLHTQKTAGTSIQAMARWAYGNKNVVSHADYIELTREGCESFPFVSGHFGFEFARPLMDGRYCFTFLRDPIERLISLHAFCAAQNSDDIPIYYLARRNDLEGFLKAAAIEPYRGSLWNHQVWQLAVGRDVPPLVFIDDFQPSKLLTMAKRNLRAFDYVGFVETFDEDATEIFKAIGVESPDLLSFNVSASKPSVESLPASTVVLLRELTALDRKLYRHAWLRYGLPRRLTSRAGQIRARFATPAGSDPLLRR
jgi:hypothetical protein